MKKDIKYKQANPESYEFGEKFIKLGKALQSNKTKVSDLVLLASNCGLQLQYRFVSK